MAVDMRLVAWPFLVRLLLMPFCLTRRGRLSFGLRRRMRFGGHRRARPGMSAATAASAPTFAAWAVFATRFAARCRPLLARCLARPGNLLAD